MADDYSRVSQGGEGRIRRVTPEENRRLTINALKAGRADTRQQEGWNLAMEHLRDDEATVEQALTMARELVNPLDATPFREGAAWILAVIERKFVLTAAQGGEDA